MPPLNAEQLAAIGARADKAHTLVGELAAGDGRWTMHIPADPERDSDLILADALKDVPLLLAEVERLTSDLNVRTGQLQGSREHVEEEHRKVVNYSAEIRKLLDERDMAAAQRKAELAEEHANFANWANEHRRVVANLDKANKQIDALSEVKIWTNEDGKRFCFVEDIADALGWTWLKDSTQATPDTSAATETTEPGQLERIASVLTHTIGYGGEDLGEGVRRLGILLERERRIVSAAKAVVDAQRNLGSADGALWRLRTCFEDLDVSEVERQHETNQAVLDAASALVEDLRGDRDGDDGDDGETCLTPTAQELVNAVEFREALLARLPGSGKRQPPAETDGDGQALEHQALQGDHGYTSHGHPCCPAVTSPPPTWVITCLPHECKECRSEIKAIHAASPEGASRVCLHSNTCVGHPRFGSVMCAEHDDLPAITPPGQSTADGPVQTGEHRELCCDKPVTRWCPCGRGYCDDCECDCEDWLTVVHEGHEGGYAECQRAECVRLKAEAYSAAGGESA